MTATSRTSRKASDSVPIHRLAVRALGGWAWSGDSKNLSEKRRLCYSVQGTLNRGGEQHLVCLKAQARRLNPAGKRDLGRPRESHGLRNESRVSEAEGHFPGISQRTCIAGIGPGSVQIRVKAFEGPNGAAVCTACSYECACF